MAQRKPGIQIKLEGFDELLKEIEDAGRNMNSAVESCIRQSAKTVDTELRNQLSQVTTSNLASRMPPPKIEIEANTYSAYVGFEKGVYNPKAKLSDGYKALFLNYGTPHRQKHGVETARGFIENAKKISKPIIKKQQKETLEKILSRLKK